MYVCLCASICKVPYAYSHMYTKHYMQTIDYENLHVLISAVSYFLLEFIWLVYMQIDKSAVCFLVTN